MKLPMHDGERYAVLVVDMQRDGLEPDGPIFVEGGFDIVGNIQSVTQTARAALWPVVHTQHAHRADLSDFGISRHFEPPSCIEGSSGADFIPQLQPDPVDVVIHKRRYDAFTGTDLDLILRNLNVRGLFVCGVLTDACVLSTVVAARNLDYKVWMIADALSGTTASSHESALGIVDSYFGDVVTTNWALHTIST